MLLPPPPPLPPPPLPAKSIAEALRGRPCEDAVRAAGRRRAQRRVFQLHGGAQQLVGGIGRAIAGLDVGNARLMAWFCIARRGMSLIRCSLPAPAADAPAITRLAGIERSVTTAGGVDA